MTELVSRKYTSRSKRGPAVRVGKDRKPEQHGIKKLLEYNLHDPMYKPNYFIDKIQEELKVENDVRLAGLMGMATGTLSRIRLRERHISPSVWIRLHDLTGFTLTKLRHMAGVTMNSDIE